MQEILLATKEERALYFQQATARSATLKNPIIIEKDFWVCWVLDQIFSNSELSPHIIFKGGTSLSKCYGIIDRFSEDIDLTLSKPYIGITDDNDPISALTSSQRGKRLEQLTTKVKQKICSEVKSMLMTEFKNNLSAHFDDNKWRLEIDGKDEQTLIFHYPSCFENKSDGYIQTSIKLEFGARGDNSPCETKSISPYINELLPELFSSTPNIKVTTLLAKRTFWEKVTLLHAEYHRDAQKPLPVRMFRHYYDIAMLDKKGFTQSALQDTALLADVVRNKTIYFPSKWANYETAKIGSLHIYPNEMFISQLQQDHKKMLEMFFGNAPDFDGTLAAAKRIEEVINQDK